MRGSKVKKYKCDVCAADFDYPPLFRAFSVALHAEKHNSGDPGTRSELIYVAYIKPGWCLFSRKKNHDHWVSLEV